MYLSKKLIAGIVAIVAIAAGTTAFAAIPDPSGVIHGCYKTSGGALRVFDSGVSRGCDSTETALDWNQQGPAGPQGAPGPSDTYVKRVPDAVLLPVFWTPGVVASLDVPAGKYVISAKTWSHSPLANAEQKCTLAAGNDQDEQYFQTGTSDNQWKISFQDAEFSLTVPHEFAAPGTITLTCSSKWGQTTMKQSVITAIKVGNLTVS